MRMEDACELADYLGDLVEIVKVGWPLFMVSGNQVVRRLKERGKSVFLDLKIGDIAETIKRLVNVIKDEEISRDIDFTTVDTSIQAVEAAVKAKGTAAFKVLTITLLTSLDKSDLELLGYTNSVEDYVLRKTRAAKAVGCEGIVASGREAAMIRKEVGDDFLIVTPGIRPTGIDSNDHKRATTPTDAIRSGADYLVIGRPITRAKEPKDAVKAILDEMQNAFDKYRR